MSQVRFSIVITCHNQRDFVRDAVDSALAQSFPGKEVIVVDDASTDESPQLLEPYGDAIRLALLQSNLGASGARNCGASMAQGEYLVFLDGDDALKPWALEVYDRIIDQKQPKIVLGLLRFVVKAIPPVNETESPTSIEVVDYEVLAKKDHMYRGSASTLVVRRSAFEEVLRWPNGMFPLEDFDLSARLANVGRVVQVLSPVTVLYRMHSSNSVGYIPPFLVEAQKIIRRTKTGEYASARENRFGTYAFVGGPIAFWIMKAYRAKLYGQALKLLAMGWPLILVAAVRKLGVRIKGRHPSETIALKQA